MRHQHGMISPVRPQERLLLDLTTDLPAGRLLCNSAGRVQFAAEYARHHSGASVVCWFLDLYQLKQCQTVNEALPPNVQLVCQSDPPADERDLVAWAFSRQGDGELTREVLQTGHERLAIGGRLIAAIDNPRDQWLHEQLQAMFSKVTRRPSDTGVVYLATKTAPLRKLKKYTAEFAFRDGERLIHLRTRPGVFSHRQLDGGARALIKTMRVQPAMQVLDLGCGSGAVGIAAALRADAVRVVAIDSNPRAVECAMWAAERNAVGNFSASLDCDGNSIAGGSYDLVLANPPYYSDFRIAQLFVKIAVCALRKNGWLLIVTKTPQWYVEHLPEEFNEVMTQPAGNYVVVTTRRR
jgi:16S rRNA G1207 methylase RsmC